MQLIIPRRRLLQFNPNMKTIKIWDDTPSERQLSEICRDLEAGQIMIWPTDTLYAIACDALNPKAVDRICRLKGINPEKRNLSIVCSDISMAAEYARFNNEVYMMLRNNTPGQFTFLCKTAPTLPKAFKGRKVVGVRIPDCKTDLDIVRRLGHPIMTTSIEADDDDYLCEPSLIADNYSDRVDMLLEGERGGTEFSTIVDCTGPTIEIVREGAGILQ